MYSSGQQIVNPVVVTAVKSVRALGWQFVLAWVQ